MTTPRYQSETSKHRDVVAPFCTGYGVDLGFGGDPVTPAAIRVDFPTPRPDAGCSHGQPAARDRRVPRPACPVCRSTDTTDWTGRVWRAPGGRAFRYVRCDSCGGLFCWPRPTPAELAAVYAGEYDYTWFERRWLLKWAQGWHRWRRVRRWLPSTPGVPSVLDIGCGHGFFLVAARRDGCRVVGVDFPGRALDHARDRFGLAVVPADLADLSPAVVGGPFDMVAMWHCLEHTIDPATAVRTAARLVAPGGRLVVAVPNAASPGLHARGEEWVWCQQPYVHTVHLSPQGLAGLLPPAGLVVERLSSRDTWDANRPFDGGVGGFADLPRAVVAMVSGFAADIAYEAVRLATYATVCWPHWAFGLEGRPGLGAELLVVGRKP